MSLFITVDDEHVLRSLGAVEKFVRSDLASRVAELVKEYAVEEGGAVTPKLGEGWRIYGFRDSYTRHVRAGQWWAHFFAGGTRDHGPRNAPNLVFTVDGNTIRTQHVRGIRATHFDQKAVDRAKSRVGGLLEVAIAEHRI